MEHAQRGSVSPSLTSRQPSVLILILMEHAQRARHDAAGNAFAKSVLILILMEHAQRGHFFVRPSVLISYIEIFTLINVFASKNVPVLCLRQCKGNDFS